MNKFLFFESLSEINANENMVSVIIPANTNGKLELFNCFCNQLRFPAYFGYNWDALYDCMVDLNWISEHDILIIHNDVPFKEDLNARVIYIKLLFDICSSWENSAVHKFFIYFPLNCRSEIEL